MAPPSFITRHSAPGRSPPHDPLVIGQSASHDPHPQRGPPPPVTPLPTEIYHSWSLSSLL